MRGRKLLPLALILAFPALAIAQSAQQQGLPSPEAAQEQALLEQSRTQVRGFSVWLGETVNDWFGDRPFEEGGKVTNGRLGLRNLWRQDEGWNTNVRFRARFDLPNLRDKAYVFIGRQNERELVTDQSEAFTREQLLLEERRKEDQTGFAGVGVALRKNLDFRVGQRVQRLIQLGGVGVGGVGGELAERIGQRIRGAGSGHRDDVRGLSSLSTASAYSAGALGMRAVDVTAPGITSSDFQFETAPQQVIGSR